MSTCNVYRFLTLILKWWYFLWHFWHLFPFQWTQNFSSELLSVCVREPKFWFSVPVAMVLFSCHCVPAEAIFDWKDHLPEAKWYERRAEEHRVWKKKPAHILLRRWPYHSRMLQRLSWPMNKCSRKKRQRRNWKHGHGMISQPENSSWQTTSSSVSASAGHFHSSRLRLL